MQNVANFSIHKRMQSRLALRMVASVSKTELINKLQFGVNFVDIETLRENTKDIFGEPTKSSKGVFDTTLELLKYHRILYLWTASNEYPIYKRLNVDYDKLRPFLSWFRERSDGAITLVEISPSIKVLCTQLEMTQTELICDLIHNEKFIHNRYDRAPSVRPIPNL